MPHHRLESLSGLFRRLSVGEKSALKVRTSGFLTPPPPLPHLINGERVLQSPSRRDLKVGLAANDSGGYVPIYNPTNLLVEWNGKQAEVAVANDSDFNDSNGDEQDRSKRTSPLFFSPVGDSSGLAVVDHAVSSAATAVADSEWRSNGARRAAALRSLAAWTADNRSELAELEAICGGRPRTPGIVDIQSAADCFNFFAGKSLVYSPTAKAHTIREPVGVCGLIVSDNYPLLLAAWKIAPAIACGNAVVIKTPEQSPLSILALTDATKQVTELTPGAINVIHGNGEVGKKLVEHPNVQLISFTGSTKVGQEIMRLAQSSGLKRVVAELGGKNSMIVTPSADPDQAARDIVQAAFRSKLYIHHSLYSKVVAGIHDEIKKSIVMGDPLDESVNFGPMATIQKFQHSLSFVTECRIPVDPSTNKMRGLFILPTVVENVAESDRLAQEEVFGPVLAVMKPFHSLQEVIQNVNVGKRNLAAGIWCRNIDTVDYLTTSLRVPTIWVNTYNDVQPSFPFGGFPTTESGHGTDLGTEAIETYTISKTIYQSVLRPTFKS